MARKLAIWKKDRDKYRLETKKLDATYKYSCGRAIELYVSSNKRKKDYLEINLSVMRGGMVWKGNPDILNETEEILVNSEGLRDKDRKDLIRFIQEFQQERWMLDLTGAKMSDELELTPRVISS